VPKESDTLAKYHVFTTALTTQLFLNVIMFNCLMGFKCLLLMQHCERTHL